MSRHGPFSAIPSTSRGQWNHHPQVHCSESVSSSASSLTYHMLPPYESQHYVPGLDHYSEPYQLGIVRHPLETGHPLLPPESTGKYLLSRERGVSLPKHLQPPHFPPNTLIHIQPPQGRRSVGLPSRAVTPVSMVGGESGGVLPCGGHCVALENFCHHCLQVIFLAGVLSGICLVVAGSLLSSTDLAVLTYIGSLTAMVSGLLLSIQCCVKRGGGQRPRPRPTTRLQHPQAIPLQDLGRPPVVQPLLREVVQVTDDPRRTHPDTFREESGIPWWRRERPLP